jgi:rod shape-determining protein MreC
MRNLLEFITRYYHWFIFVILEVISFTLLFSYNNYQGSVWFTSANAVMGKAAEVTSDIEEYFKLAAVNEQLTQRNVILEQQVSALKEQLLDSKTDSTKLLGTIAQTYALKGVRAKVINITLNRISNLITIDKGAADGIRKDMGVVCGTGIVGIVFSTSAHYSIVLPILNDQSTTSCMINGRGYFGSLKWYGKDPTIAYLEDIPRHARFNLGDQVVTSGYSTVFPRGVNVGRILHVYNSNDGMSYRAMVKLSTDFGNLRHVVVMDNAPMQERLELLQAAQDTLSERK